MNGSEHTIDVERLLRDLQQRIHTNTQQNTQPIEANNGELRALHEALHELELTRVISAHWPIEGNGIIGRVVALLQKVTRRLLRWYINPIVEQQNSYNDAVLRALRLLVDSYQEQLQTQGQIPPGTPSNAAPLTAVPESQTARTMQQQIAANEAPFSMWEHDMRTDEAERNLRARIQAHWPLPARNLRDRVARIIHMGQRFLLRWYINPIVDRMNQSNRAIHLSLVQMSTYMIAMRVSLVIDQVRRRHE
ncbi:MAG: hypothetical protein FJ040_01740 [Chloroflexi bacterium]|nr:hypothetical protein [Chloroflexota bacterium]